MRTDELKSAKPFIKWAGGKRQLIPALLQHVPAGIGTYYEPFIGGGALFWEVGIRAKKAVISDLNKDLIVTYEVVRDRVEDLIGVLSEMQKAHSECYYYSIRASNFTKKLDKAAAFIYLNRTCFNGLYRVNKKGKFNVPYGKYKNPTICDEENLRLCSKRLNETEVEIRNCDFTSIHDETDYGDFVYLDPPYLPIVKTSFTAFTKQGFTMEDHKALVEFMVSLKSRGAKVVMSNSFAPDIVELCKSNGLEVRLVQARRAISSVGDMRTGAQEIIVV